MSYLRNDKNIKEFRRTLRKNQTEAEGKLWKELRRKQVGGYKFLRQYSVGKYVQDFYCAQKSLAIEIDGGQHGEDENIKKDEERTEFLKSNNIKVLRFWNNEVLKNIGGVLTTIRKELGLKI